MIGEEFDWNAVSDSIVQRAVETVAVYENTSGDIVIRQRQAWDEDDDTIVVIARANASTVAQAILVAADDRAEVATTSAAARQRRYRERKRNAERDSTVTDAVTERDAPQMRLVG
jgi:hypothetical protein